jgi:signal transduction histidine kinase
MIKNHRLTILAILFSFAYSWVVLYLHWEIFEYCVDCLGALERYELDEVVLPAVVVLIAVLADAIRRQKISAIEVEKARVYKAMIYSVHHVMNNFLNQMQLFKMAADMTPGFDPKMLELYESVIRDALTQIQALSTITKIDEGTITKSVLPVSQAESTAHKTSGTAIR